MTEISKRTKLITVSLGSGKGADVMFLFMDDICGENETLPRHGKAFVNLRKMRENIEIERVKALKAFVKESKDGLFPDKDHSVSVDQKTLKGFLDKIK